MYGTFDRTLGILSRMWGSFDKTQGSFKRLQGPLEYTCLPQAQEF